MLSRAKKTVLGGIALAALTVLIMPGAAFASGGTAGSAEIAGSGLTMVTPATVDFGATLNGNDQVAHAPQVLDVLDYTGTGAGWNVTLSATAFTDASSHALADDAVTDESSSFVTCDATCTQADNLIGVNPVVIDGTASRIMTASVDTGLGGQQWSHDMALAIPANTHAGTYTSTWTYSVTSAP